MLFKTGLIPSPLDSRDYVLTAMVKPLKMAPPDECLTWLNYSTPPKYQGDLGACTAFATSAAMEIYNHKEFNKPFDFSEQFIYGEAKKIDGLINEEGTYLRAIFSVLKHTGICEEAFLPYEGKYPPLSLVSNDAFTNASKYKISSYASVLTDKNSLKTAIFQTGPVIVGIKVYTSFENTPTNGIVTMPSGALKGGHAIALVGYNDIGLIAKNSWSVYWGKDGYCTIPWNVWDAININEAWSIVDIIGEQKLGIGAMFSLFCRKG